MNVFLDTDVIIDYLADRKPYSDKAEKVFALIESGRIKGMTSSLCFSNLYYLLKKTMGHSKAVGILKELAGVLGIVKVDKDVIMQSFDSGFKDFEDAIQYHSAIGHRKVDIIVTRNIRDYKHAQLPVMTPDTLIKTYTDSLKNR